MKRARRCGVIELVNHHWDKIDCEFALNEGGVIAEEGGKIKYVGVATSEKVPRTLFVSAAGTSGHGSAPRADNPVVHLATAIAKIGAWQPPVRFNEITRIYFQRLAQVSSPEEAWLFTHFNDPVVGAQVQEILRRTEKLFLQLQPAHLDFAQRLQGRVQVQRHPGRRAGHAGRARAAGRRHERVHQDAQPADRRSRDHHHAE